MSLCVVGLASLKCPRGNRVRYIGACVDGQILARRKLCGHESVAKLVWATKGNEPLSWARLRASSQLYRGRYGVVGG